VQKFTDHNSHICNVYNCHYSYVDTNWYLNMMDTFKTINTPIYVNVTTCVVISVHVCRDLSVDSDLSYDSCIKRNT